MLNRIIHFALHQPLLIVALAILVVILGARETTQLPVDVFPDLNRPRVVIITEAHGMAPEEIERRINLPLEQVLTGANGVEVVRSSAGVGISVIFVEFAWGTDIYTDRQIVDERLEVARSRLPEDVQPQLAPIASIMGQIMLVGLTTDDTTPTPSPQPPAPGPQGQTSLLKLRQIADWDIRRRLMSNVDGLAQVFVMGGEGGGARQVQVLVNPNRLRRAGVTLHQVEEALQQSNENSTGGWVDVGPETRLVRILGRVESLDDLRNLVIDKTAQPPVLLSQVAQVQNGPEIPFGIAAVNGKPAVMLVVVKQPGADTRKITQSVLSELEDMQRGTLPDDVVVNTSVYRMDKFIDRAIHNVQEALRDGVILVVIVLALFLLNFRTTFITLTAIPLSILVTILVFTWLEMSINTMTLGGLAVAIGELVDDAIVDIENIYRRLRENRLLPRPRPALRVIYEASVEVRNSIVFSTIIVILVFVPLFFLGGMEGRLFAPLGLAYIVSIIASLLVSLTVTPVLALWLLPKAKFMQREREGWVLRNLRAVAAVVIRWSMVFRYPVLLGVLIVALLAAAIVAMMGRNFLPPFNEGSVQASVALPPATSLKETNRMMRQVDEKLLALDFVETVGRRTGRAEEDEHVMGVSFTEIILEIDPESELDRGEQLEAIRDAFDDVPGAESKSGRVTTEQPISHLMSHMLSGVKAQIAIKIYGDDLEVLRKLARDVEAAIDNIDGIVDLMVEPQVLIPQIQIKPDRRKLAQRGLQPGDINHLVTTAMKGQIIGEVYEGDASYDLIVRFDDAHRADLDSLRDLAIPLPSGGTIPLEDVADVLPERFGPNSINRENGRRRIVVQCNVEGRAVSSVREDIVENLQGVEASLAELSKSGQTYYLEYGGQFESEQAATRTLLVLSVLTLAGIFLALYALFRSVNLALQVMAAVPMAAIGAVAALLLSGQSLSVPSMVGFISLAGIASRNGILLIAHYLHLVEHEGEDVTRDMVVRAGVERVAPVLMTALTSGIALVPLILAGDEPGKEILYPVATVIVGGLISSTLLDFLVHPALFWVFGRKEAIRLTRENPEA